MPGEHHERGDLRRHPEGRYDRAPIQVPGGSATLPVSEPTGRRPHLDAAALDEGTLGVVDRAGEGSRNAGCKAGVAPTPPWHRDPVVFVSDDDRQPGTDTARPAGIRAAGLRALGTPDPIVTAGYASAGNDGAAEVLVATISRHDPPHLAHIVATADLGAAAGDRRIGTVRAAPAGAQLTIADTNVIGPDGSFVAKAVAARRQPDMTDDARQATRDGRVIAIGRPRGVSGARQAAADARQLQATGGRCADVTLCVTLCAGASRSVAMILGRS